MVNLIPMFGRYQKNSYWSYLSFRLSCLHSWWVLPSRHGDCIRVPSIICLYQLDPSSGSSPRLMFWWNIPNRWHLHNLHCRKLLYNRSFYPTDVSSRKKAFYYGGKKQVWRLRWMQCRRAMPSLWNGLSKYKLRLRTRLWLYLCNWNWVLIIIPMSSWHSRCHNCYITCTNKQLCSLPSWLCLSRRNRHNSNIKLKDFMWARILLWWQHYPSKTKALYWRKI